MDRNYLALPIGDAINPLLAVVGYNFRRLLRWPAFWLVWLLAVSNPMPNPNQTTQNA